MIDLSDIVRDPIFTVPCELIQRELVRLGNGRTEIVEIKKTIQAVIQPATDKQLLAISDLLDAPITCGLTYYGVTQLSAGIPNERACDRIRFNGALYDVAGVSDYIPNGNYCQATLTKCEEV